MWNAKYVVVEFWTNFFQNHFLPSVAHPENMNKYCVKIMHNVFLSCSMNRCFCITFENHFFPLLFLYGNVIFINTKNNKKESVWKYVRHRKRICALFVKFTNSVHMKMCIGCCDVLQFLLFAVALLCMICFSLCHLQRLYMSCSI